MKTQMAEYPNPPVPHVPRPEAPQQPRVQAPTVFVYERQEWEYRVIAKNTVDEPKPLEEELNALGNDGWELVSVLPAQGTVQYLFKRVKA